MTEADAEAARPGEPKTGGGGGGRSETAKAGWTGRSWGGGRIQDTGGERGNQGQGGGGEEDGEARGKAVESRSSSVAVAVVGL